MSTFSTFRIHTLAAGFLALGSACAAQAADFAPCADATQQSSLAGSLCQRVSVPSVYVNGKPEGAETLSLFVRKFPAAQAPKGAVWLVAGGPGESGASMYPFIDNFRRSFPGFDVMVPDHRGTGYSTRLCPTEESPESAGGTRLVGAEWGGCFAHLIGHPERSKPYSITQAAWDLKTLVDTTPKVGPVYLYGVSYGTQLVLRTLQLGGTAVDGAVLDSLVPLETDAQWELSRRSEVVDDVGRQVLARCDAQPACKAMLGAPAIDSLRKLIAALPNNPKLMDEIPGGNLKHFLGRLLDVPAARERIPYLIKDLQQGSTTELQTVTDLLVKAFEGMGTYPQLPPSIPLVNIISGSENNLRPTLTKAQLQAEEDQLLFTSPLAGYLLEPTLPLYTRDALFGQHSANLPKVLVFHGTLDPKTHYDGALKHVAALRQHGKVGMVTVEDAPHFVVWTAPACFERLTAAFVTGQSPIDQRCGLTK